MHDVLPNRTRDMEYDPEKIRLLFNRTRIIQSAVIASLTEAIDKISAMASSFYFMTPSLSSKQNLTDFFKLLRQYECMLMEFEAKIDSFKDIKVDKVRTKPSSKITKPSIKKATSKKYLLPGFIETLRKSVAEKVEEIDANMSVDVEVDRQLSLNLDMSFNPPDQNQPSMFLVISPPLLPDMEFAGKVVFINDPNNFFVRSNQDDITFKVLEENLQKYFSKTPSNRLCTSVIAEMGIGVFYGSAWVAFDAFNKKWCRVRINSKGLDRQTIGIQLVDTGKDEFVPWESLYEIPEEFTFLPATAIPCSLHDTRPKTSVWDEDAKTFFENFVLSTSDNFQVNVMDFPSTTELEDRWNVVYNVSLKNTFDENSVNSEMVLFALAKSDSFSPVVQTKPLAAHEVLPFIPTEPELNALEYSVTEESFKRNSRNDQDHINQYPQQDVAEEKHPALPVDNFDKVVETTNNHGHSVTHKPNDTIEPDNLSDFDDDLDDLEQFEIAENAQEAAFGFKPDNDPTICIYFNSPGGCRNGEDCPFKHVLGSGQIVSARQEICFKLTEPDPLDIGELYYVRLIKKATNGNDWLAVFCCGATPTTQVMPQHLKLLSTGVISLDIAKYLHLESQMKQIYSKVKEPQHIHPAFGTLVAVMVNGTCMRARVISSGHDDDEGDDNDVEKDHNLLTLRGIDAGGKFKAHRKNIYTLNGEHTTLPSLVRQITVTNIDSKIDTACNPVKILCIIKVLDISVDDVPVVTIEEICNIQPDTAVPFELS